MKKHMIIALLFSIQLQSYCQVITTPVNCNDSVLMSYKGNWKQNHDNIIPDNTFPFLPRSQFPEVYRRLDAVHGMLQEAYPQPTGNDATWWRNLSSHLFAHDINYKRGIPIYSYSYYCAFGYFSCLAYRPKAVNISGGETSTWLRVFVNEFGEFTKNMLVDTMSVNGLPVYWKNPGKAIWKSYELVHCGESSRAVLITREGELPYKPVTRKQYLDYSIRYLTQLYDQTIQSLKEMPVRSLAEQEEEKKKALDGIDHDYNSNSQQRQTIRNMYLQNYETDQQIRDKNVATQVKLKEDIINRYQKELGKTITTGLLNSPAVILQMHPITEEAPIFVTGEEGGKMLITDNPSYIRRDLPKYIPQFIVLYWEWNDSDADGFAGGAQGRYYRKMLEANFPIEKLQAMIDK